MCSPCHAMQTSQPIDLQAMVIDRDSFVSNWSNLLLEMSDGDAVCTTNVFNSWATLLVLAALTGVFTKADNEMLTGSKTNPLVAFDRLPSVVDENGDVDDAIKALYRNAAQSIKSNDVEEVAWSIYRLGIYIEGQGRLNENVKMH